MFWRQMTNRIGGIFGLSYQLARANFRSRNEGSYLGVLWYLLEPLAFFSVLLFLGGSIYNNSISNYPAYLLLGLIMFNFFLSLTSNASSIMYVNRIFLRSIKINPIVFIIAGIIQSAFSHIFEVILFMFLLIYLKIGILYLLFYPIVFILLCLFTAGVSMIFATIGVYILDWGNIWLVAGRLIWFITPVFYVVSNSNYFIAKLNYLNPMSHFITITRNLIIYHIWPTAFSILGLVVISLLAFLFGYLVFNFSKKSFAEKI